LQLQGNQASESFPKLDDTGTGDDQISIYRVDGIQAIPPGFPPFRAPFIQPQAVPFQLSGNRQDAGDQLKQLDDTGTGADAITLAAAVPLADTGAGVDASAVAAAVPLAETGTGADASAVAAAFTVTDTGTGDDASAVTATFTVTDTGAAADAISVATGIDQNQAWPGVAWMFLEPSAASFQLAGDKAGPTTASVSVPDTGSGSDTITITASVPLADTGSGADALSVTVVLPLAETGAGTDASTVAAAVPLIETGAGSDSVLVLITGEGDPNQAPILPFPAFSAPFIMPRGLPLQLQGGGDADRALSMSDTGTAADAISVVVTITLAETGTGVDAVTTTVALSLSETATAVDAIVQAVTLVLTEAGVATDTVAVVGGGIRGSGQGHGPHTSPGNVYPRPSGGIRGSVG
jgi:hypothetical protein